MTPDLEPKDRAPYLKHIIHQLGNLRSLLGSVSGVLPRWKNPSLQIWCVPSTPDHVRVTFPLYAKAKGNNSNSLSPKSQETYYFQPGNSLLGVSYVHATMGAQLTVSLEGCQEVIHHHHHLCPPWWQSQAKHGAGFWPLVWILEREFRIMFSKGEGH